MSAFVSVTSSASSEMNGWKMPAESAPQDQVWMGFPSSSLALGIDERGHHKIRTMLAAVAHAVAEFEPVTMVVDPSQISVAQSYLRQRST